MKKIFSRLFDFFLFLQMILFALFLVGGLGSAVVPSPQEIRESVNRFIHETESSLQRLTKDMQEKRNDDEALRGIAHKFPTTIDVGLPNKGQIEKFDSIWNEIGFDELTNFLTNQVDPRLAGSYIRFAVGRAMQDYVRLDAERELLERQTGIAYEVIKDSDNPEDDDFFIKYEGIIFNWIQSLIEEDKSELAAKQAWEITAEYGRLLWKAQGYIRAMEPKENGIQRLLRNKERGIGSLDKKRSQLMKFLGERASPSDTPVDDSMKQLAWTYQRIRGHRDKSSFLSSLPEEQRVALANYLIRIFDNRIEFLFAQSNALRILLGFMQDCKHRLQQGIADRSSSRLRLAFDSIGQNGIAWLEKRYAFYLARGRMLMLHQQIPAENHAGFPIENMTEDERFKELIFDLDQFIRSDDSGDSNIPQKIYRLTQDMSEAQQNGFFDGLKDYLSNIPNILAAEEREADNLIYGDYPVIRDELDYDEADDLDS